MPNVDINADADVLDDTRGVAKLLKPEGSRKGPSPRTVEGWRERGTGPPFIKVGRRVLYRRKDVRKWLAERTRTHTGAA